MNSKQLRLGNLVNFTFMDLTEQYTVYSINPKTIGITDDVTYEIAMVSGIKITKDILINSGFIEYDKMHEMSCEYRFGVYPVSFSLHLTGNNFIYWKEVGFENINYVHELQNTFFIMTGGSELEINQIS